MRLMTRLVVLAFSVAALPGLASAQVNEEFADLAPYIEQASDVMRTDRKVLIRRAMNLTEEEDKTFWTPYRLYTDDMQKVRDKRIKLITDYAANIDNITDKVAREMIRDYFDYSEQKVKVQKKHLNSFLNVTSYKKVIRFYQLENKVDSTIDFALAMRIPLIDTE